MNFTQAMEMVANYWGCLNVRWDEDKQAVEYLVTADNTAMVTTMGGHGMGYTMQAGDTDAAVQRSIVICAIAFCIKSQRYGVPPRDPSGMVPLREHFTADVAALLAKE